MVTTAVPSEPSLSTRRYISSIGTGFEKSSNSLQYVHARLQRRIGMMCASNGWSVEAMARTAIFAPRRLRCRALARRRRDVRAEGIVVRCIYYSIDAHETHALPAADGKIRGLNG